MAKHYMGIPFIKMATESDLSSLERLLKECGLNSGYLKIYWRDYFYVQIGNNIIGCAAVIPKCEGICEVKSVCVDEDYRSTGIFDLLMEGAMIRARHYRALYLVLKVDRHNPARFAYFKKDFIELNPEYFQNEYDILLRDCKSCHSVIHGICNPMYLIRESSNQFYKIIDTQFEFNKLNERGA